MMGMESLGQIKHKLAACFEAAELLRETGRNLKQELDQLQKLIAQKNAEIEHLRASLKESNIAGAVAGVRSDEDATAAKAKITELMREIDRCIALLNV